MFSFLKSKKEKKTWFSQFRDNISNLFLGKKTIDHALLESLETVLLTADIGIESTDQLIQKITARIERKQLSDTEALKTALHEEMIAALLPYEKEIVINKKPFVILVVGVNGAGKTTTIAKMANFYRKQGKSVMLAAGDTFRAAAIEQLQMWGVRNQVTVVAQQPGADSASVIYDALQSAHAKNIDILIADTAGRLHTQSHLMNELKKVKRVMQKLDADAPQETMLIVDATIGQNALNQAREFDEAIGLSGIAVTKCDGTAKGGMVFAITEKTRLPIRFIGTGEHMDDLSVFSATAFVNTMFDGQST